MKIQEYFAIRSPHPYLYCLDMHNEIEMNAHPKLVNKAQLLKELFDDACRPSMRWLNYQTAAKAIPYVKIGGKVFFDVPKVRAKLAEKNTVCAR